MKIFNIVSDFVIIGLWVVWSLFTWVNDWRPVGHLTFNIQVEKKEFCEKSKVTNL